MPEKQDVARPRLGQRVPSGPRALPSRRSTSNTALSQLTGGSSLATDLAVTESDEPFIAGASGGFTASPPETSPTSPQTNDPFAVVSASPDTIQQPTSSILDQSARQDGFITSPKKSSKLPSISILSPKPKKPLRVNTSDLLAAPPGSSPKKAISPSLKHWQQVRSHVLSTPLEEKAQSQTQSKAKGGIVGKAAAKLGFRSGTVDGQSAFTSTTGGHVSVQTAAAGDGHGGLSQAERDEIARERRGFARDIRTCLDSCAAEDSRRRLANTRVKGRNRAIDTISPPSGLGATLTSYRSDFSPFAPLLTELHKYLPAARSKKPWSRTCPHHAVILSELGTAFLPGEGGTTGERQQALEVFGVIVRSWSADGPDEELSRWIWLCRALKIGDRQLRNRGLTLLSAFLHRDPTLPSPGEWPSSSMAFQALAVVLFELYRAVDQAEYDASDHRGVVLGLLADLGNGSIIDVDRNTVGGNFDHSGPQMGGIERELLWLALGKAVRAEGMTNWLFASENPTLLRFAPPPLLHATPPIILNLRLQSSAAFLGSLGNVIPHLTALVVRQVYATAKDLIISQVDHLTIDTTRLPVALGGLFLACLLFDAPPIPAPNDDPFRLSAAAPIGNSRYLVDIEHCIKRGSVWSRSMETALQESVEELPIERVLWLLEVLLGRESTRPLATSGVTSLLKRIDMSSADMDPPRGFLVRLARYYPQILYKSLFSLAAASVGTAVTEHLKTVRTLSTTIGTSAFWLEADPQMVAVVLMGDSASAKSKGKGKEGEVEVVNVRLGRYAVLVEFLLALSAVDGEAKAGSRMRGFLDALEGKLGQMLFLQEKEAMLPTQYRALVCMLSFRLRSLTRSTKKADWQRVALRWFFDASESSTSHLDRSDQLRELEAIYRSLLPRDPTPVGPGATQRKGTMSTDITSRPTQIPPSDPLYPLLHPDLLGASSGLLVLLQSCWTLDDWNTLLPILWKLLGATPASDLAMMFMLNKCGEIIPAHLRALVDFDLHHASPTKRISAIHKLSSLYSHRHQITSLPTLSSRRGPLFRFPNETLDFVLTEIGSSTWSASHESKQEALQKYGATLPVVVRQRLMELGWSDDPGLQVEEAYLSEPISSLPIRHLLEDGAGQGSGGKRGLGRQNSGSGSDSGGGGKAQKAIFSPVFWELVAGQAAQALGEDGGAASLSLELVRLLQRDEPALFIRPFIKQFSTDFRASLSRLNAAIIRTTPGFAYVAFNAIVGYLKHSLRLSPKLDGYAEALTTVASLVKDVPEVSLRDIRKNKSEHVLLPASIHEEEGGFRVHPPWRDELVDVQSAQMLVLAEVLKVNPREVGIIKRMMSNVQLQRSSLQVRTFARSWLGLIVTLFALVNRNYTDRAELRDFLNTATTLLNLHSTDLLVVSQAIRLFMLCSARFRRLFAVMGFQTTMRPLFDAYVSGGTATRDGIEYAMRSFYRIHQDSFVYQACLAISSAPCDAGSVHSLLACLAEPNGVSAGISSGLRGLNDKEEQEALIQLLSGPEIALSEIGKDRAVRQAEKLAQAAAVETRLFAKESMVRLFVTVIAANPPSVVGINMLNLFGDMVQYITDEPSRRLVADGVEALGEIISREKVDAASAGMLLGEESTRGGEDWAGAKLGYVRLVDAWTRAGGAVSQSAVKTVLGMISALLVGRSSGVSDPASSILGSLAKTELESNRPVIFLKAAMTTYQAGLGSLDLSRTLGSLSSWIRRNDYDIDGECNKVILEGFIRPALRHLASTGTTQTCGLQQSVGDLLSTAVLLPLTALDILEAEPISARLLAFVILPLVMSFDAPFGVMLEKRARGVWIRLLHIVIKPRTPLGSDTDRRTIILCQALSLSIIKVICIRALEVVSSVRGLWAYIAQHIISVIAEISLGDAGKTGTPSMTTAMAWSMYELLSLHRCPLMLHMRYHIRSALASLNAQIDGHSRSPSPSPELPTGLGINCHSARAASFSLRRPSSSSNTRPSLPPGAVDGSPSSRRTRLSLSPSPEPAGGRQLRTPRLSPSLPGGPPQPRRPTFTDLSLRRSSNAVHPTGRPTGEMGMRYRFPSSADTRKVGGGGAIVHLLGAPVGVATAPGGGLAPRGGSMERPKEEEAKAEDVQVGSEEMLRRVEKSIKACKVMFGYPVEEEEEDEPVKAWSVSDALLEIAEETRVLIEVEFGDILGIGHTRADETRGATEETSPGGGGYDVDSLVGRYETSEDGGEALSLI